jgi:hypothetical protein
MLKRTVDALESVRKLTEPDDVRPHHPRGSAARAFSADARRPGPAEPLVAGDAPSTGELAVHVEQPRGPRALVQIVDILGHEQQFARPFAVELRQRLVRRIRLD